MQMPKAAGLQISAMAESFLCIFWKIGTRTQTWRDFYLSGGLVVEEEKKYQEILIIGIR